MHLLYYDENHEPALIKRVGRDIPPYAILSHTWGPDDEEITFKDVKKKRGKDKSGFKKVEFCLQQAANDGLQYCWVDTCCIDKSSSAELSEAINSMFSWYRNAVKCYVFMTDVSVLGLGSSNFGQSRWFTRGWTLQELIAPPVVEFYSFKGTFIGDKRELEEKISLVTGISVEALRGRNLYRFEVDERLSWAEKRQTSREEDAAYSLLGIFDIYMPILYGEGGRKAMIRLRKAIEESLDEPQDPPLDYLTMGQKLVPNQALVSRKELFSFILQDDGNLVLYGPTGVLWASCTMGRHDVRDMVMQDDGNLVIYVQSGGAIWDSGTYPWMKPKLVMQNDGNVVIYSNKVAIWSTGTMA